MGHKTKISTLRLLPGADDDAVLDNAVSMAGMRNASVLPVPVLARPKTSRPVMAAS